MDQEVIKEYLYWQDNPSTELSSNSLKLMFGKINTVCSRDIVFGKGLEIGCGNGRFAKLFPNIIGVDFSFQALSSIKNKKVFLADAQFLPFEDEAFDYVVTNCLHHMPATNVIKEVYRVLKPNAPFLLFEPNRSHFYRRFFMKDQHKTIASDRGFYLNEFINILIKCLFTVDDYQYITLEMQTKSIKGIIQTIMKIVPGRFTQTWFYVCAKKG